MLKCTLHMTQPGTPSSSVHICHSDLSLLVLSPNLHLLWTQWTSERPLQTHTCRDVDVDHTHHMAELRPEITRHQPENKWGNCPKTSRYCHLQCCNCGYPTKQQIVDLRIIHLTHGDGEMPQFNIHNHFVQNISQSPNLNGICKIGKFTNSIKWLYS